MEWTGLNELREKYLSFFESKGHLRLGSFPLVPHNDNSLLLINSGMAPMKKWFLGQEEPPRHRVTTCQKCIRTPDIERVGITARHGTFFEMLGNFSFQDYFKEEAIPWAWEFLTGVLKIEPEKLYISVYLDDDEAYDIWTKKVGISEDHMVRFGKEDNFWEHGSGPCGPCSEIYFDRGPEFGCGKPDCKVGCDCDRYMEVWNLVFSQFDSDGAGNYTRLEKPNIDTGMGLERLACVMQGVSNLFEVDTVHNILNHVEKITGKKYGESDAQDISIRVITDHIRSTVFMVSDGILPSNEGRGYVLRRLLRRAARHGRMLGVTRPFLAELCDTVIRENGGAYPELVEHSDYIKKTIAAEEERFSRTIDQGLAILNSMIENLKDAAAEGAKRILSGPDEGAMQRNMYYSSVLGVNLGMFYKRRDYSRVVNGRNPIVAHEYLGESVEGKDVFVADDIISSGESMLDIAFALKKQGARRIFANATYAIFTNGLAAFDEAVEQGVLNGVFGTNLTYLTPELKSRAWFHEVDVSKYIAYYIAAVNHDISVSAIIDPHEKIRALLEKTYGQK